jgi:hypothetical protein
MLLVNGLLIYMIYSSIFHHVQASYNMDIILFGFMMLGHWVYSVYFVSQGEFLRRNKDLNDIKR